MAAGYTPWLNLFFFPLLVYFLACRRILFSSFGISVILALTLLQGGTHIFIWFVIFVILYDISSVFLERNWRYLFHIIIVIMLAPLLSFIRIYATAQAYANFHQPFQPGYNPINFLVWAIIPPVLIAPVNMFFLAKVWFGVPSWDGAMFWGLPIIMIPLMMIKYKNYRNSLVLVKSNEKPALNYDSLLISSSVLFCLSFFSVFELLIKAVNAVLHAPFIEGAEKYPFRLMIPAFLGFSVLIAHFSPNIWQTIDKWLNDKWDGNIASRHTAFFSPAKIVMYISIVLFIVLAFAVVLSFIFAPAVLSAFMNIVKNAYYGKGSQWLAQRIDYLEQMAVVTTYFQLQIAVSVVCIFSLIIFLILKNYSKYKKTPYISFEITLVLPLLFSSLMWFSLAISKPHTKYKTQNVLPPYIQISPDLPDLEINVAATPQKLTIYPPKDSRIRQYILTGIPAADSKFLDLISKNASLSESDGFLSILPQDSNPIVLAVKSANYKYALYLTITAWVGLICISIVSGIVCRRAKTRPG